MKCKVCGAEIKDNAKVCPNCGHKTSEDANKMIDLETYQKAIMKRMLLIAVFSFFLGSIGFLISFLSIKLIFENTKAIDRAKQYYPFKVWEAKYKILFILLVVFITIFILLPFVLYFNKK